MLMKCHLPDSMMKETRSNKECVRLVFFGSPLLDITARCTEDFLARYSLEPDGTTVASERHQALFDHLLGDPDTRKNAGGSALHSAKIARWALGPKGQVSFAGCVGEDECASLLSQELQSYGVEPLLQPVAGTPTGSCACLLSEGGRHRALCTRRGAAALFRKEHLVRPPLQERICEADALFVVGYLLPHSADVVFELAEKRRTNQIFALSLSAEYVCRDFREAILRVLPRVDVLLGNERELMALAETLNAGSTVVEAASFFANREGQRIVVVSRGPEPLLLAKGGSNPPQLFPVSVLDTPLLDTVGCGDALAGTFLALYIKTGDPEKAIRAGILAAAEIARTSGCAPPIKTFEQLLLEWTEDSASLQK